MICNLLKKPKPIEETRPTPIRETYPLPFFYPNAIYTPTEPLLRTVFEWDGLPEVFILHFLAGQRDTTPRDFFQYMRNVGTNGGLCTYFQDENGQIYQQHSGNRGGYHAGKSFWNGKTYVSSFCGGLEIANGGKLEKHSDGTWRTWFGKVVPESERRFVPVDAGYNNYGMFEKFTVLQEQLLIPFCKYLLANGVKEIIAHDDVSPGRKNDISGALSLPLPEWLERNVYE